MVDEMHPQNIRAAGVIQLLGGVGPNGNVQATILTQQLAAHLDCPAWLLPSQSIEHSVEERAGWWAARTWRRWSVNLPKWMWRLSVLASWSRRSC
jgi:DNA-binding transcriptional regulator LsrR (DeoR family)